MFKKLISNLTENKKNVVRISTGTIIGQVISVLTLPIIARLYGPETIGIWTFIYAIVRVIVPVLDLGMTHSIMIENDEHIDKTYRVINTISLAISILSAVFIILYYYYFSESTINIWFLLLFVFILLYTTQQIQVCYTWLNRNGEFGILMKNPVINNGVYSITSIILGVFGLKAYGYFIY